MQRQQDQESGPGFVRPSVSGKEQRPASPVGSGVTAPLGRRPAQCHRTPPPSGRTLNPQCAVCGRHFLQEAGTHAQEGPGQQGNGGAQPYCLQVHRVGKPEPRSRAPGCSAPVHTCGQDTLRVGLAQGR